MHTDEYTISLSRELAVCAGHIRSLQKTLKSMERKFNCSTETFIREFRENRSSISSGEGAAWSEAYEALLRWKERASAYEDIYLSMKR